MFGAFTLAVAVVAPFDHAKVAPVVLDVAFKFKLVLTQFNTVSIPALIFGTVIFCVTTTASLAVHLLYVFVTVTV